MPTPVLERERYAQRTTDRDLRAYGKLAGREEEQEMTEAQKALHFNAQISDNYQRLINPEYGKEEEFVPEPQTAQEILFGVGRGQAQKSSGPAVNRAPAFEAPAAPVYEQRQAPAYSAPEFSTRLSVRSPAFETQAPTEDFASPAYTDYAFEQPAAAQEVEDLMPTATTIQYKSGLFEDEKPTVVQEKKSYSLTAKGKLLMAVYALVVVVILALIIVNTSVLRTLDSNVANQEARLSAVMAQQAEADAYIEEITSDEYIIDWAENHGFVAAEQ